MKIKCLSCNAEWNPPSNYTNSNCPFCESTNIQSQETFEIVWKSPFCAINASSKGLITSFIYTNAKTFSEGLASVEFYGKWGFIDIIGEEVIPVQYEATNFFPLFFQDYRFAVGV